MSQSRQLAAIMFTDIVGYTTLMGQDEEKAFGILKKNREIQRPLVEQYGGRWIKELGDGALASFPNATDAVLCAGAILQSVKKIQDLELCIGIHLGDVVFENNDVFGDGVNIAARLMSLAPSGSICISEAVSNNVTNKKGIITTFLREETLKNVKEPVRIYEVSIDPPSNAEHTGDAAPVAEIVTIFETVGKTPEKSIAVLPFVNMSNDPDQEYFSDGMTEEILNSLAHLKDLRVAGRTSSFHFKGKNIDLRKIGQKLNVQTVLEGSVRKQGNKLRITAQLVNVDDGYHIWSERYDREMDDIFAIQDEIALAITEKLKITLLEDEKAIISKNPTENKEAYDLYLKGRFYFNKRGAAVIKGLEYFQLALEKDPAFALAYTGMADSYYLMAFWGVMLPHDAMPKAKQYAEKALQLQPASAEAYTALAFISTFYDWNWAEAKKQFQKAFELNPNYGPAHSWYGYYLSFVERDYEASIQEAKYAADHIEPLSPIAHHILAIMYNCAGQFEEGLQASKTAIELDANSFAGYRSLGLSLAGLNKYAEAIVALKTAVQLSLRQPLPLVELCWVYSLSGNEVEIENILEELVVRSKTEYISAIFMCCVAYYSKEYDKALEYMELAFEQRDSTLVGVKTYPVSSFGRTDPRFQPYLERMNFPG